MSLTLWLFVLGAIYLCSLVFATVSARKRNEGDEDFLTAGGDLGFMLGSLTVAATLFSTFTLLGMPDFFRTHGVGGWIFLAVSDAALAFAIIWFGIHLRRKATEKGFRGVAGLMQDCYGNRWSGYIYLAGVFIFMVPYVSIQIRGISIFMSAIFPEFMPIWGWATCIVLVMLTYSELGGLKAIIYADAIQGVILLSVTLLIAYGCISSFGNLQTMFEEVRISSEALLSTPGPKGLLTSQFLIASFLVIVLVPVTQPQMTIRLVIMRDVKSLCRMAVLLSLFAFAIIAATTAIGMYGAVKYPDLSTSDFLAKALIFDQLPIIGATVAIGLIAAAISTADSQLFALGSELRSVVTADEKKLMTITKSSIVIFALTALITAIFTGDELVLLARLSFAGTAMLAPLIIAAVLTPGKAGLEVMLASGGALLLFIGSIFGFIPEVLGGYRLDLLLLVVSFVIAALSILLRSMQQPITLKT